MAALINGFLHVQHYPVVRLPLCRRALRKRVAVLPPAQGVGLQLQGADLIASWANGDDCRVRVGLIVFFLGDWVGLTQRLHRPQSPLRSNK
jgi:hypothetical protein